MRIIRYGIPALLLAIGIAMLIISPDSTGLHGLAMGAGAALSVLLLNWLFRLGAQSDRERDAEEAARDYYGRHGRWPDEPA